ncbi:MAG: hypothetical protein J0J01_11680 [Reyranella sp.]|uniref:hypothetical protein n=1 Tax=Reyranella sp. TaxID=1929291 RepID=UPI001ACE0AD4|nr:hypothetical protein [Reyranella sp.]MBN9087560.1 hypothetical protein [Reyranella sp.]
MAVAALGWLVAGLIAFVFVVWFGFAGIGLIGLLLCFICVRIELEKDAAVGSGWTPHLIASQHEAVRGNRQPRIATRMQMQSHILCVAGADSSSPNAG